MKIIIGKTPLLAASVALAALILSSSTAFASDTAKGGELKLLSTVGQVQAVQTGDAVVMTCPKCKTVTYTQVKATARGGGSAVETMRRKI